MSPVTTASWTLTSRLDLRTAASAAVTTTASVTGEPMDTDLTNMEWEQDEGTASCARCGDPVIGNEGTYWCENHCPPVSTEDPWCGHNNERLRDDGLVECADCAYVFTTLKFVSPKSTQEADRLLEELA